MLSTYRLSAAPAKQNSPPRSVSLVFLLQDEVRAMALREGSAIVIGRGEPSHVRFDHRSLSRAHVRIAFSQGRVIVEDLQSTNGTLIDGALVTKAEVAPGAVLRAGELEVLISVNQSKGERSTLMLDGLPGRLAIELERARYFERTLAAVAIRHRAEEPPRELQQLLRAVDYFEAYGPHVTLAVLPEVSGPEVETLAASLHQLSPSSFSIGAALFPGLASVDSLIAASLTAMREATCGRGCVLERTIEQSASARLTGSPRMLELDALIARAARTTIPLLVLGETGSGKESAARLAHDLSPRRERPYKAINCAALHPTLLAATLFGHERGAFTGAERASPGLFEQAHGGTLFFDEVAELSLEAQAALLRVLETKRVVRLGATREIDVDVRVIAATHRELAAMVRDGRFREDLLYRLDAFTVRVPPLRERPEDIEPLAAQFLRESRQKWNTVPTSIAAGAREALRHYAWPGNVRQLRNVIERAATVCASLTVEVDDLPDSLFAQNAAADATHSPISSDGSLGLVEQVRRFEAEVIRRALRDAKGRHAEAASALNIPRRTLSHKVQHLGLR